VVDVSAKVAEVNEITPQSDYVMVFFDGACMWDPRFDLGATHCSIDVSWFPFDLQKCSVIFESWLLTDQELSMTIADFENILQGYQPTDEWKLSRALLKSLVIFFSKMFRL